VSLCGCVVTGYREKLYTLQYYCIVQCTKSAEVVYTQQRTKMALSRSHNHTLPPFVVKTMLVSPLFCRNNTFADFSMP